MQRQHRKARSTMLARVRNSKGRRHKGAGEDVRRGVTGRDGAWSRAPRFLWAPPCPAFAATPRTRGCTHKSWSSISVAFGLESWQCANLQHPQPAVFGEDGQRRRVIQRVEPLPMLRVVRTDKQVNLAIACGDSQRIASFRILSSDPTASESPPFCVLTPRAEALSLWLCPLTHAHPPTLTHAAHSPKTHPRRSRPTG